MASPYYRLIPPRTILREPSVSSPLRSPCLLVLVLQFIPGTTTSSWAAEPESFDSLQVRYAHDVKPLVKRFCLTCHSTERMEGELDLERFAAVADVRRGTRVWQKVVENLDNGEMPPKKAKQPSAEERQVIRGWIERYLDAEAHASAGDPGPVVLRRLSNAEYTYTVRDLTSVDLSPAREFPQDGAAGEGFTNAGNALVMSPSLLTKYLDAAKEIASHAVLLPDGFRFSPSATRRDWTNEVLAQIREFYSQFTDSTGSTQVNLQGIISETNTGGRLPLEKYFAATIAERARLASGGTSLAEVAKQRGLNAKYLGTLWQSLNGKDRSPLLDGLRGRWRTAKPESAGELVAYVAAWQNELWRFGTVGHIGKVGGPKAWMSPVSPVATRQELRYKFPAASDND